MQESYDDYKNREGRVLVEMNDWRRLHKMMGLEKGISPLRREELEERN